jgi:hypothetical protein
MMLRPVPGRNVMIRVVLIAAIAAALGGCVDDRPNPPGWIDRNRDGVDDRVQGNRGNPNNPPGWVDRDRDGVDDRVERRRGNGYYDRNGVWRSY